MANGVIPLAEVLMGRASPRARLIANSGSHRRLAGTLAPPIALRKVLPLVVLLALDSAVFAHRLDEYLQATIVVVEPNRIRLQINLTPGVAVAEQVMALIDRNRDGIISTNESAAYSELLKQDLVVRLDQRDLKLILTSSYFPGPAELRTGWAFIQIEFSVTPAKLSPGPHSLTIENRHLPGVSVYLINAAQPASGLVQIIKQTRNENQSFGEIEFGVQPSREAKVH